MFLNLCKYSQKKAVFVEGTGERLRVKGFITVGLLCFERLEIGA
jgi:hypothetical protein